MRHATTEVKIRELPKVEQVEKAFFMLIALNNSKRKAIIRLLEENDMMTVTEIYIAMRAPQSETSTHLSVLRKAGIVDTKRQGKYRYYFLNKYNLVASVEAVSRLAELAKACGENKDEA